MLTTPSNSFSFVAFCLILPLLVLTAGTLSAQEITRGAWHRLADDLEIKRVVIKPETLFAPELLFVRTNLKNYRVGVVRAEAFGTSGSSVKQLCQKSKARLGINASFFDERGRALGLIVSQGNLFQGIHSGGETLTGVFQLTRAGVGIVQRREFRPEAAIEAVQAGPRLVTAGNAVRGLKNISSYSRRSGVCIDAKSRLLFYVSSGLVGIGIGQLQGVLLDPQIGCVNALNLDGGGSAQFFLSDRLPNAVPDIKEIDIQGSENIPVMLGLFMK
ncbi:MAG: phosphodiester glycosidase family protein [Deltaproteobacteria bacterium]|nr:phosphodiester glycosidase family protein [Deltaproteobacteria bacterium]